MAILVECLTDNRNRTISDLRRCFTRAGGSLGEPNSVAWQFTEKGYIGFNRIDDDGKNINIVPDDVFMTALDLGAEDVEVSDDLIEVYTGRTDFAAVSQGLEAAGFKASSSELLMQPNSPVELSQDEAAAVLSYWRCWMSWTT